jgi:hypothetical protein
VIHDEVMMKEQFTFQAKLVSMSGHIIGHPATAMTMVETTEQQSFTINRRPLEETECLQRLQTRLKSCHLGAEQGINMALLV